MQTAPAAMPVAATSGTRLLLPDGRELVDGVGSWWTCVHGYNHPHLVDAARKQLDAMPHVMLGGLAHEPAYVLAQRLAELTPGDLARVFFTESGSVAVEVAMKIAVQYWQNAQGERRTRFVAFRGGYHGDTFATMSVCDPEEGMHALFAGALAQQHIVDVPEDGVQVQRLEHLLATDKSIAAVMIEPLIQGAGGMRMHAPTVLKSLRRLCDAYGVPLILDEVFTGFGRTGSLFACEQAGIAPDIMVLGKALTGGVTPLAATIASEKIYAAFHDSDPGKALMHGPTFSGHAIGCAVANASLDLFAREHRLDQVASIERTLREGLAPLASHDGVCDVRVRGAVGAVAFKSGFDVEAARAWFIDQGLFIRPIGKVVYLTPAYTIGPDDLGALVSGVARFVESSGQ